MGEGERGLSEIGGPDKQFVDVQGFGDRLDLIAREPEEAKKIVQQKMAAAEIQVEEVRVDEPALENVFVATLRGLGQEVRATPFPSRHDHKDLRGQIAIGATKLTKEFGTFAAVKAVSLQVRYGE